MDKPDWQLLPLTAILFVLGAGCEHSRHARPTGPISRPPEVVSTRRAADGGTSSSLGTQIFPVEVGNNWRYRWDWQTRRIVNGVEGAPVSGHYEYEERITRVNAGPWGCFFDLIRPGWVYAATTLWWQNEFGLHAFSQPIAPTSGGPAPTTARPVEPTRRADPFPACIILAYPLHPGARWAGVGGDHRVEGVELLSLPMGRVRAFRVFSGSDGNWCREWYGPCGRLRTERHIETPVAEVGGRTIGAEIYDSVEEVVSFRLVDCQRCLGSIQKGAKLESAALPDP